MASDSTQRQVRVVEVEPIFSIERPAGTFAFGGSTAGDLTLAHVRVRVEDRQGKTADGWGAIFLSHPWAFPGPSPNGETKNRLMKTLLAGYGLRLSGAGEWGHPLDHFLSMQQELSGIAASVADELDVTEPVPDLFTLVAYSPIDAALHDAYGNLHGASSYHLLGQHDLGWDLSRVLGLDLAGKYPGEYLRNEPVSRVPISHTVGATDPLTAADAREGVILPLEDWIRKDGVWSFKVKLKGQDLGWDVNRVTSVYQVAQAVRPDAPVHIFADLNEQAPSVEYIQALLDGIEAGDAGAWQALDALEQPLSRHLGPGAPSLSEVSARIPVVLDEGLTSLDSITQARELGWSGIALKTCKTQSLMLLALARAQEEGLHVSVQDLTNPGIALLHSVGLAARLPVTRPIETNARQYYPATSAYEAEVFPEVYTAHDGTVIAENLTGPGLGYGIERIPRPIFR
jgi:L-alanine-DL-glutamate epimerase-like enolase superfamily enzyme